MRTTLDPKSTSTAASPSSVPITVPRPYRSWLTRSPTENLATATTAGGGLKGLPGSALGGPGAARSHASSVCPLGRWRGANARSSAELIMWSEARAADNTALNADSALLS
jgi:hypothetical protein